MDISMKQPALPKKYAKDSLCNSRGLSLIVLVMVLTVAAAAAVSIIVLKVRLQDVQRESLTKIRLDTVHSALQRYYLTHHDLPEAAGTTPANTVPVEALNLEQRYRLDAQGQFFHYNRLPETGNTDILGIIVNNTPVAAVLAAAGPDGVIADANQGNPYDDPNVTSDDIVVGVPLRAEATKIAQWTVEVLQREAIAYSGLFEGINNNGIGLGAIGGPSGGDTYYPAPFMAPGPDGIPGTPDDIPVTPAPIARPGQEIDEDGCVAATGGVTFGCLHFGILSNDPDCGTASLENCPTLAGDIVAAFGLNQKYITDPWGNAYQWESIDLVFYSMGQDRAVGGGDDILATEPFPLP